jgi:hypothetical protein
MFLILGMGVGCNYNHANRSCIGSLTRRHVYISGDSLRRIEVPDRRWFCTSASC